MVEGGGGSIGIEEGLCEGMEFGDERGGGVVAGGDCRRLEEVAEEEARGESGRHWRDGWGQFWNWKGLRDFCGF